MSLSYLTSLHRQHPCANRKATKNAPKLYTYGVRRLARGRFYTAAFSVATHRLTDSPRLDASISRSLRHSGHLPSAIGVLCLSLYVCIEGTRVRFNICCDLFHFLPSPPVLREAPPSSRLIGSGTSNAYMRRHVTASSLAPAQHASLGMIPGVKPC